MRLPLEDALADVRVQAQAPLSLPGPCLPQEESWSDDEIEAWNTALCERGFDRMEVDYGSDD
jgi:hypothetical protein